MTAATLDDWIPLRVFIDEGTWKVDWIHVDCPTDQHPHDVSFYDFWLESQLRRPFNLLFRRQTSIETLLESAASRPGLPLAGIILHMTHCGSTLVARLLAADTANLVLIEPYLLQRVAMPLITDPPLPYEMRVACLRALVSAMGRPLGSGEQRLFLKLSGIATLNMDLLRAAFPDIPWVFLYRQPVEVLLSQLRLPAGETLPGYLDPARLGIEEDSMYTMPLENYIARLLACICSAAAEALPGSRGMALNYNCLPQAVWQQLASHFGLSLDATQVAAIQAAARYSAKGRPGELFRPDSADKQSAASMELHRLAEEIMGPSYRRLEASSVV